MINVFIEERAYKPTKAHKADAGWDLYSPEHHVIFARSTICINTGVHFAIPEGYFGEVKSRSSMMRKGVITDGTIDSGYAGAICVVLHNLTDDTVEICKRDRIAQLVIQPINTDELECVNELEKTERGEGGFGSSGK